MSTIPTTSRRSDIEYTVAGGKGIDRGREEGLSVVLLKRRQSSTRSELFDDYERLGIREILSVEDRDFPIDVEALILKHANLRFLHVRGEISIGEKINVGIEEARGEYVFVFWDDTHVRPSILSTWLIERMEEMSVLCAIPLLQTIHGEMVPHCRAPAFYGKQLKILPLEAPHGEGQTLYPFDYCGIYHRKRFLAMGGFDFRMRSCYWQKVDFGFRSHMWGERILVDPAVKLLYTGEIPAEDTTRDESYKYFYLKNLAVRIREDQGILPRTHFLKYWLRTGGRWRDACWEFKQAREWVWTNRFRFRREAASVTELWER